MPPTHEVFNQPPALTGYDVADDPAMLGALRREGAGWAEHAVRDPADRRQLGSRLRHPSRGGRHRGHRQARHAGALTPPGIFVSVSPGGAR